LKIESQAKRKTSGLFKININFVMSMKIIFLPCCAAVVSDLLCMRSLFLTRSGFQFLNWSVKVAAGTKKVKMSMLNAVMRPSFNVQWL